MNHAPRIVGCKSGQIDFEVIKKKFRAKIQSLSSLSLPLPPSLPLPLFLSLPLPLPFNSAEPFPSPCMPPRCICWGGGPCILKLGPCIWLPCIWLLGIWFPGMPWPRFICDFEPEMRPMANEKNAIPMISATQSQRRSRRTVRSSFSRRALSGFDGVAVESDMRNLSLK